MSPIPLLSRRQLAILELIRKSAGFLATRDILTGLQQGSDAVSRVTVIRDVDDLVRQRILARHGKGRGVCYEEIAAYPALRFIDPETYFSADDLTRTLRHPTYHSSALGAFSHAFSSDERKQLLQLNDAYRKRMRAVSPALLRKEMGRFTIEFSWKSSQIEGNTYSLLDTEALLLEQHEAAGHSHHEAQMILNHKAALDFIVAHPDDFSRVTLRTIEHLHALLVKDLDVPTGLRSGPVAILGTTYKPLRLRSQIREALAETVERLNAEKDPLTKALIALLMIAYIQPFEDGNKRTSRLLGNALLIAANVCPLSFRSIDEKEYKKAVILFDEQQNIRYFKELFVEQFRYAAEKYFLA